MGSLLPFPSLNEVTLFGLVMSRMAGIFSAIPLFGGSRVPRNIKAVTILVMTLVLFPVLQIKAPPLPTDSISLGILVVREALIGITLGLLSQAIFSAVEFCGQLVGTQMGISIASQFDPTLGGQSTVIATFQGLLAMLIFMSSGVHHVFIRAMVESYQLLPVGAWQMNGQLIQFLISATTGIFVLAIKLAAPVMVSLLATSVALGVMSRAFPQMNVFMVSFPLNIGIGFLVLGLTLMVFIATLQSAFADLPGQFRALFKLLG